MFINDESDAFKRIGLRSLQNVLRDIVFCLRPFVFLPSQEIRERRPHTVSRQLSPSPY